MSEKGSFKVVYPFGEGDYALPEAHLDTFFMEVHAAYERVLRAYSVALQPADIPQPEQQRRSDDLQISPRRSFTVCFL